MASSASQKSNITLPILEITQLIPSAATTSDLILKKLQIVRSLLAERVQPTHSRFYRTLPSPTSSRSKNESSTFASQIVILGFWPSVKSHLDFLADEGLRSEVLSPQEGLLDWRWTGHVRTSVSHSQTSSSHLETSKLQPAGEDVVEGEREASNPTLSEAGVIQLSRWTVKTSDRESFLKMLKRQDSEANRRDGDEGFVIGEGWDVDGGTEGEKDVIQYIRVVGWRSEDAQHAGRALEEHPGWVEGGWFWEEEQKVVEYVEAGMYIDMEAGDVGMSNA